MAARKPKASGDPLLVDIETAVRDVLKTEGLETADRLKAIDSATRLAMVKHKINGSDDDEGFFGGSKK